VIRLDLVHTLSCNVTRSEDVNPWSAASGGPYGARLFERVSRCAAFESLSCRLHAFAVSTGMRGTPVLLKRIKAENARALKIRKRAEDTRALGADKGRERPCLTNTE